MTESHRSADHRKTNLAKLVIEQGGADVDELAEILQVSVVTVYRDVAQLEKEGIVSLDKGRVRATASSIFDMSSVMRSELELDAKQAFAQVVAPLVPRGASIIVDDSSSVLPALDLISEQTPVTIVTNSLAVLRRVGRHPSVDVQMIGGKYAKWSDAFYGNRAIDQLREFQVDVCLMSDSAVSHGFICNPYDYVSALKRAMLAAAQTSILLVDHTKFSRRALIKTAAVTEFDYVITDKDPGDEFQTLCRETGTQIVITHPPLDEE